MRRTGPPSVIVEEPGNDTSDSDTSSSSTTLAQSPRGDVGSDSTDDEDCLIPAAVRIARLLSRAASADGIVLGPRSCSGCGFWHQQDDGACPSSTGHYFGVYCSNNRHDLSVVLGNPANYVLSGHDKKGTFVSLFYFEEEKSVSYVETLFQPAIVLISKLHAVERLEELVLDMLELKCVERGNRPPWLRVCRFSEDIHATRMTWTSLNR